MVTCFAGYGSAWALKLATEKSAVTPTMRMNLSKTSIELTPEQDMLSTHATNSALAGALFQVRRDGPAQSGTRNRRFNQTFRLRILGEFLHKRPALIPAFRNGDGVSLDTPPAFARAAEAFVKTMSTPPVFTASSTSAFLEKTTGSNATPNRRATSLPRS